MTTLDLPDPDENAFLVAQEQSDVEAACGFDDDGLGLIERERSDAEQAARDEAFSAFYREHFTRVVAFVLYLGAPRREAEDLAQETMRRVYLNWEKIKSPLGWALTDASREFGHWEFRTREEPAEIVIADEPSHGGHGRDDWLDVHELMAFLKTLPLRQRQVIAWTLLEYKPREIAEILGISSDAVRGSLRDVRDKCRKWRDQWQRELDEDSRGGEEL